MAYAALVSLFEILEHPHYSQFWDDNLCPVIFEDLEDTFGQLCDLSDEISKWESSSSRRGEKLIASLDRQMKEATCTLVDVLESYMVNRCLSQSESLGDDHESHITVNVQEVENEINFFIETVKKIKEEYHTESEKLSNLLPEGDPDDYASSKICFRANNSKVIGLDDELKKLKDLLITDDNTFSRVIPIFGMVGIGKTILANEIYEHPLVLSHFESRVWVTVGPRYDLKQILLRILEQTNSGIDKNQLDDDKEFAKCVCRSLEGKRYLLVLDDVWNTEVLNVLPMSPENDSSGARIILTTRIEEVAYHTLEPGEGYVCNKKFLNTEESWFMFLKKIFGEDLCPAELEKVGKKIVENCEGLPFAIIAAGKHLSKAEKTLEYWTKVAEKKINVFDDADDEKVIFSSYKYLSQESKYLFLYMGVFPHGYKIPASKLIQLWYVEGLLMTISDEKPEDIVDYAMDFLEYLVSNSCVLVRQQSSNGRIKTCGIHYIFQNLCISEARKEKFFHVISDANRFTQDIRSQRRLCTHSNVLLGITDVYSSIASISTARSLLCTGPYHQYPIPMFSGLRMLKVIDAVTIRFYNFPVEVLKSLQLRYLAFTYDGKLPHSISKLQNLHYLIVKRHVNIKSRRDLPLGIWNMQELRHLQVMGSDLPDPPRGASLQNLIALIGVSSISCTSVVLNGIPNLKKLGIQFIPSLDSAETFCIFDRLAHLDVYGFENIKCVIVNPNPRCRVVAPLTSYELPLYQLKKLSLSGFGYPWEYMNRISALQNLEVLKLRYYAFQGPEWIIHDGGFSQLKFLLLEDIDLVQWRVGYNCFESLETLSIRHCYKLEKIPPMMVSNLEMIELVDLRPSIVLDVTETLLQRGRGNDEFPRVCIRSSLDDEKLKS